MKLGATDSIKFKKLKMKLKIPHWQAVGLLESIWLFTSRNAPEGDIGRHPDEDIAAAIEWDREPSELIQVLVECRWLDRCDTHRLLVHDWADHLPNWLKGNLARYGRSLETVGEEEITKPKRDVSSAVRFAVLQRDGFRCRYCGRKPPDIQLQCDHIIPIAKGGSNDQSNLAAACEDCNFGKSDSILEVQ